MSNARKDLIVPAWGGVQCLPLDHSLLAKLPGFLSMGLASGDPSLCIFATLTAILKRLILQVQTLKPTVNKGHSQLLNPVNFYVSRMCFICSCINILTSLSFKSNGVDYMLINIFLHLHLLYFSTVGNLISSYKKEMWPRFPRFSLWDKMFQLFHARLLGFVFPLFGTSDFLKWE